MICWWIATEPMKGIEPLTPSLPWKCSTPELHRLFGGQQVSLSGHLRAGDETRTHDPQLGRLMLYQLSYARTLWIHDPCSVVGAIGLEPIQSETPDLQSGPALQLRRAPSSTCSLSPMEGMRASRGTRTPDQLITNQLLYQLSYTGVGRGLLEMDTRGWSRHMVSSENAE